MRLFFYDIETATMCIVMVLYVFVDKLALLMPNGHINVQNMLIYDVECGLP